MSLRKKKKISTLYFLDFSRIDNNNKFEKINQSSLTFFKQITLWTLLPNTPTFLRHFSVPLRILRIKLSVLFLSCFATFWLLIIFSARQSFKSLSICRTSKRISWSRFLVQWLTSILLFRANVSFSAVNSRTCIWKKKQKQKINNWKKQLQISQKYGSFIFETHVGNK